MGTLDQESLFSLEVVVDTLALEQSKLTCRFPAIAFRLLDFPTLLIHHVEPDLAETIRKKINADPHYKTPKQLPELQDRHGKYLVKKGKSCLFKVSANTLQTHLQSTPLYVMVIDTFPEVPKLVASCTVPLDFCMDQIYNDLRSHGISVPSAHGEKGDYQLCNLMGRNSGNVVLGVRLLSLGVGLLSHIPEGSVAQLQKKGSIQTQPKQKSKKVEQDEVDSEVGLYDIGVAEQTIQVSMAPEKPDVDHLQTQTEQEQLQNVGTQTRESQKKLKKVINENLIPQTVQDEMNDFFITNTECPPSLFFNCEQKVKTSDSLLFSHYPQGLPWQQQAASDHADSDSETIRSEDTFSDAEVDSSKLFKSKPKEFIFKQATPASQKPSAPQVPENFSNLPILNALLHEIAALQGTRPDAAQADLKHEKIKKLLPKGSPQAKAPVSQESPRPHSPGRKPYTFPKETSEEFVSRLSSPRRAPPGHPQPRPSSPEGVQRHLCEAGQQAFSKVPMGKTVNKGWLRNRPASEKSTKTKLEYGMTHSQKLRLAKGNPALLESLKQKEEERKQQSKDRMMKKWGKFGILTDTADISTEISRHKMEHTDPSLAHRRRAPGVPRLELWDSTESKHHKKPVPTPRHSVSGKELQDHLHAPPITPRKSKQPPLRLEDLDGDQVIPERDLGDSRIHGSEQSSRSDPPSSRIEVHMPPASLHVQGSDDDSSSIHSAEHGVRYRTHDPVMSKNRPVNNPGFPNTDPTDLVKYSDDFDAHTSTLGEEPGFRRVVDRHSESESDDHGEPQTGTLEGLSAGDELGLRCIVDKYSDDSSSQKSQQNDSYHSAASQRSHQSNDTEAREGTTDGGLRIQMASGPHPSASSPNTISVSKPLTHPNRHPFTAISMNDPLSVTQDSTAYIRRSQVASQLSMESTKSVDSVDDPDSRRGPHPLPRTPRSARSIRTESVSSYAPSDAENTSPPLAPDSYEYSEDEDHLEAGTSSDGSEVIPKVQTMRQITVAPEAKLGYTWGGY